MKAKQSVNNNKDLQPGKGLIYSRRQEMKNKFFTEILFLLMLVGILLYMPGWALSAEMQKGLNRIWAQNTIRLPSDRLSRPKPILRQPPSSVRNPSVPVTKNPAGCLLFTPDLNGTWRKSGTSSEDYKMNQWRDDQNHWRIKWYEDAPPLSTTSEGKGKMEANKLTTQYRRYNPWGGSGYSEWVKRTGVLEVFFNANWVVPTAANCKKNSWLRIRWDDGTTWLK
jgi:hypothetical protein